MACLGLLWCYHFWFPPWLERGRRVIPRSLHLVGGCDLRCLCQSLCGPLCHLHQKGPSSCWGQYLAIAILQQSKCCRSTQHFSVLSREINPGQISILVQSFILAFNGSCRYFWDCNWLHHVATDSSYESSYSQHQWDSKGLCTDNSGMCGVF